jgi:uncharacterized repeat protein (TIGR01451 family)
MKKLFALIAVLLMLVSTSMIVSPVKAVSSATVQFKQPTYAYKGSTRQIEVKVSNTGAETINNLWLGVDLVQRTTGDNEEDKVITASSWVTVYSFGVYGPVDKITVRVMAKIDRGPFNWGEGQGTLRAFWTPWNGVEVAKGQDLVVNQDENSYSVKQLLTDEPLDSNGILDIKAFVTSFNLVGVSLNTDWAVISAERRVEATRTPIKPSGADDYGGIDFGNQQGLALAPGAARTFAASYSFSTSQAYGYTYDFGAYYWDIAVWKDGYPGQGGETAVIRAQKPFTVPYPFDMTVSIEWDITPTDTSEKGPSFANNLVTGLRKASEYLFDATDGQMCFGKITIYDNGEHWDDCDLRIHEETDADNPILDAAWPKTSPSLEWAWPPLIYHIEMGRKWIYQGAPEYDSWDDSGAYQTLIHEFGHFKLGLLDEYMHDPLSYGLGEIANMIINNEFGTAHCVASLMDDQWTTYEFCNPANHDPDKDTWHEIIHHKSCWSIIKEKFPWIYIPMQAKPGPYDKVGNDISFDLGGRSGGPDYFGYTYLDSNSLIGPVYDWVEISGTGTMVLPSSDDQWVGGIGLDFFFNYYGTDYSQLAIGNNGLLFSGAGTSQYVNQPIMQTPGIHGLIAPFWDDIVTWGSADAIYYETQGTSPNRKFVVEWNDNQHYSSSSSGITFEAILYEGTNNILFQYKDLDFGNVYGAVGGDNPPYNNGGSATVGIEDPTGNIGLQYSFNQQAIAPGLAILFKFPAFAGTNMYLSMNAPASMDRGSSMTYTLYYNDFGDVAASNVVLQATLSTNVDFVSASDGGTYDPVTRRVTWNIGTVPAFPSGRGSRTVSVTIPSSVLIGTVIITTASMTTSTLETRYDDNSASAQTTVTGSSLPPNVGVGPILGNPGGTPSVYWTTPITFTYNDPAATGVDIRIHFDSGGADITGSMTGGPPLWSYTTTFYPRSGHATVTYTVHYPASDSQVNFGIYVDPAGYIYDVETLVRISGASVWLQRSDGQGGWENVPTGQAPPIMQPDVNPQITGADGQYQWDVLEGTYRVHVEAPGYYPADSIVVNIPPPVTDLHVGLTPLPPPADDIPPTTTLTIGNPKYIGPSGNIYVTSATPFTLSAEDNLDGAGVAVTGRRVRNATYDSGWITSPPPIEFYLTGLTDGEYFIDYNSTDNLGNIETHNVQEVILDNTPPTTTLDIGEPKYIDPTDSIYVSSVTTFTLIAEDNPDGAGVASTFYRIYSSTYDSGWLEYSAPFYLTGLTDGEDSIDYYSTDNIGNIEPTNIATVILDNTPPSATLTIGEPKYVSDKTYVTPDTPFTLEATDTGSGVHSIAYRIHNAAYDSGWQTYTTPFKLTSLADGTYTIEYNSTDNDNNIETTHTINVTLFSWNYIYQDTYGRGTTLKINIAHKFLQFTTPDKDYGIRNATYMRLCGRAIIIQHCDSELRLITVAVDTKLDFCLATAWDMQTHKRYLLIDKPGIEGPTRVPE